VSTSMPSELREERLQPWVVWKKIQQRSDGCAFLVETIQEVAVLLAPAFASQQRKWGGPGDSAFAIPDVKAITHMLMRNIESLAATPGTTEKASGGIKIVCQTQAKPSDRIAGVRVDDELFAALHPAIQERLLQPDDEEAVNV
jgi:hypothetical protein